MQGLSDIPPQHILGMQDCHAADAATVLTCKIQAALPLVAALRSNIEQKS